MIKFQSPPNLYTAHSNECPRSILHVLGPILGSLVRFAVQESLKEFATWLSQTNSECLLAEVSCVGSKGIDNTESDYKHDTRHSILWALICLVTVNMALCILFSEQ